MKAILTILILLVCLVSQATVYHVAASGGDFANITAVNAHGNFAAGDQVLFNKGETFFGLLDIKGHGVNGNPLTYGSYGTGANPVLTGFQKITGWTNEGEGIYSKIISPVSAVQIVTIDGVQYGMGRTPNTSYLTWESSVTNVSITDNAGFTESWIGAEIVLLKNGFTIDRCTVTNQVSNTLTYTSLGTTRNANTTGNYFIQNSLETLDTYGEWHYSAGKLSVYFGAVNPTTKTTKVAINDYVIFDSSAEDYITIDGLTIEGSNLSAVKFGSGSNNIIIQNCTIRFIGASAIELPDTEENPSDNAIFSYNTIIDCVQGIEQDGDNALISHNTLTRIGSIAGIAYAAVNTMGIVTDGNLGIIEYNDLNTTGYSGIFANINAVNTKIRYNKISETCKLLDDAGSIYLGHVHTGTEILNNIVLGSDGNGIYMDEYCQGVTTSYNTVYGSVKSGIFLHKASSNSVLNNVCFDNLKGLNIENWTTADTVENNIITGNQFISKTANQFVLGWINRYPGVVDIGTMDNNYYCRSIDETTSFRIDVIDAFSGSHDFTFAEWKAMSGQDANSKQSPKTITAESELMFSYNDTNAPKVSINPFPGMGVDGITRYGTSFTLPLYSGLVVWKDLLNPTGSKKQGVSNLGKPLRTSSGLPVYTN